MHRIKVLCIGLCMASLACKNNPNITINSEKEILDSKAKAEKNTTHFEGRFVGLTKLNSREYTLVLQDSTNKLDSFRTIMPLDSFEISLLAKKGHLASLHIIIKVRRSGLRDHQDNSHPGNGVHRHLSGQSI